MSLNRHRDASGLWAAAGAVLVTSLYALALYFCAATASLYDSYQPGIEWLRVFITPGGLLFGVFLIACLNSSYWSARLAILSSAGAILVCLLMLAFISIHDGSASTWVFPENRSLFGTVRAALFQPSFSNRSFGSVVASGFFALVCLGGSLYISRRRHNQSSQRTASGGR
jgi:hypothetical protein